MRDTGGQLQLGCCLKYCPQLLLGLLDSESTGSLNPAHIVLFGENQKLLHMLLLEKSSQLM